MADTTAQLAVKIKAALDSATGDGNANQIAADDLATAFNDFITDRVASKVLSGELTAPNGGGPVTGTVTTIIQGG